MDDDLRNRFRSKGRSYDSPVPARSAARRQTAAPAARPKAVSQHQTPGPNSDNAWADAISEPKNDYTSQPPNTKKRKKKRSKKWLFAVLIILLLAAGFGAFRYLYKTEQKTDSTDNSQTAQPTAEQPTGTIRMFATGDNLAFESVTKAAKTATGYDYLPMMDNFKPLFEKADIRLCTETTIGGGEALGLSGYPTFNAPTAWSTGFAAVGCNVMNLASDHTNDKGQPGIDAMVSTWKSQQGILAHAGANTSAEEQATIRYFTVKQVKFAHLSYTTKIIKPDATAFGVNLYNAEQAVKQITEARKNANLVLVSITWGNEDQSAISGDQDKVAQELATAGADVIIGNGPHVLQPAKILEGVEGHQTLVWYSLGNFLNSQLPINNLIGGMAVMEFDVATKQLRDPKLLPVYMHYEWTAAQKAAGTIGARTNFKLFPLDQATDALAKSQHGTTVAAQTAYVTSIITKDAPIKVIASTDL